MDLKPIKTKKIYEEIVEQIRHLVTEGQLQAGDRLPSERDLGVQLNVSRASVREALSALEMMGVLEIRSGEGTFIKEINVETLVNPLSWMISMDKGIAAELLEVRKMIEVQAVALAAKRATPGDMNEIEDALRDMYNDLQTGGLGDVPDHRFHYAIAQASHNKILLHLMNAISDTMEITLKASRLELFEGKGMPERLYLEHCKVFEAIKDRNVEAASLAMMEHLTGVEKELLDE